MRVCAERIWLLVCSGQRLLEEIETESVTQQERDSDARLQLQKSSKILTNVKSGIEHLAMKLAHLKSVSLNPRLTLMELR